MSPVGAIDGFLLQSPLRGSIPLTLATTGWRPWLLADAAMRLKRVGCASAHHESPRAIEEKRCTEVHPTPLVQTRHRFQLAAPHPSPLPSGGEGRGGRIRSRRFLV